MRFSCRHLITRFLSLPIFPEPRSSDARTRAHLFHKHLGGHKFVLPSNQNQVRVLWVGFRTLSAGFWCVRSGIHPTIWRQPSELHQLFFERFWGVLRDIWSSSKRERSLGKVWLGLRIHWQKWCFYSWKQQFEFIQFGWGGGGPIHPWWQINSPPYDKQPPVSVSVDWYWNWGLFV